MNRAFVRTPKNAGTLSIQPSRLLKSHVHLGKLTIMKFQFSEVEINARGFSFSFKVFPMFFLQRTYSQKKKKKQEQLSNPVGRTCILWIMFYSLLPDLHLYNIFPGLLLITIYWIIFLLNLVFVDVDSLLMYDIMYGLWCSETSQKNVWHNVFLFTQVCKAT